jgi:hypothetical protein
MLPLTLAWQKKMESKDVISPFPFGVSFTALERRMSGKRATEPVLLLTESWDALDYLERKQERLILHGSFHIACSR